MLVPAAAQVSVEVLLHKYVVDNTPSPAAWRRAIKVGQDNFESALLNVPGLIGTVACPTNVIFAASLPAGGTRGWAKVAALGTAIFYLNSGLCGTFLDPPNYTEASSMPEFMHSVRPYAPAISCGIVEGIVATSILTGRWEPPYRPIAVLTGLLTLVLGSTLRNHDRLLDASQRTLADAVIDARKEMATVTHDDLQEYKEVITEIALEGVAPTYDQAEVMLRFPAALRTVLQEKADPDHDSTGLVPLDELPRQIARAAAGKKITVESDVRFGRLARNHVLLAQSVVTGLCWNAAQAIQRAEFPDGRSGFVVRGWTDGDGRGRRYSLLVEDFLPPVPADVLEQSRSFRGVRARVEDAGGTLTQESSPAGGKAFVATWPDWTKPRPPRLTEETNA